MTIRDRRFQAGMSMVELIVGMAITGILLVGITGVLSAANGAYTNWIDRIQTSGTGDALAAALAADSHRYVSCSSSSSRLDFCVPGSSPSAPVVSYINAAPAPYTVMRVASPSSRVLVRNLAAPVAFQVSCRQAATVDVGYISVLGLPGRSDLRVYFQTALTAPAGCRNV
jgi:prepilin-type N-terminal cleavage/methylation domain-containing protein